LDLAVRAFLELSLPLVASASARRGDKGEGSASRALGEPYQLVQQARTTTDAKCPRLERQTVLRGPELWFYMDRQNYIEWRTRSAWPKDNEYVVFKLGKD